MTVVADAVLGGSESGAVAQAEHFVRFYRDEQLLIAAICDYVREAITAGAAAVVIATAAHLQALERHWRPDDSERLILLDAEQTLAGFMVGGVPERERFFATVGTLISDTMARHGRVAAFGEMVALLWKNGQMDAAVQLEQLWNELGQRHAFRLFCAYPLQECAGEDHIEPFKAVCACHTRVIPAEHVARTADEQGALIAQLQQQALVLQRKLQEERQTQRALAHFAAIVASSDDAIIGKTLDGRIQSWNAAAERIFGWTAEEAIGQHITLIIPPERHEEELRILDTLAQGARIDHFETARLSKDGRRIDVSLTISPIRDPAGAVIGASKIARDITQRRRAETLLQEREQSLRQAHRELQSRTAELMSFNQAAVGRERRIMELKEQVNGLLAQLGRNPVYALEFESEPPPAQEPPAEPSTALAPLESILRTEEFRRRPARPPDYEAESRALTTLVAALAKSPATILQVLSETILQALQAGSAGLSLLRPDGRRFCWTAIAGAWSPHVGGGTPRDFGPCGDVLERQAPLLFTHWEKRYPYLASATPLAEEGLLVPFFVSGTVVGTLWAISHDVQRQFDAEDLRLLESLARFASVAYQAVQFLGALDQRRAALNLLEDTTRARQLAEDSNRKLREHEQALLEADRRKNEFLALLGHELRNPLAPIRNAGELLARTLKDDASAQLAVAMIRRQTAQLTRLVDDLLDVGRITQGLIKLQRMPVDLAAVIAQAVETAGPLLREKHHEVSIVSNCEPQYVLGDFVRLVQCVVNVLTNAAKYTDSHGHISIELRPEQSTTLIAVGDDGAGIAPDLLPHLFEPFVQAERTLDRSQGGLGLGLAVARRLVEMHEGEITAQSEGLGRGSRFEMRLPRIERPVSTATKGSSPKATPQRVLIVDDNADAADSLSMLLALQGHDVRVVYSGTEVIACVGSFRPELVFLDIGLPGMDGYEVAKQLRAVDRLKGMRIFALTGYGQPETRQRALAAGFDGHLVKPLDLPSLERVLAGAASAG